MVVVGAGGGSDAHLQAAQLTGSIDVVGVVDRDRERAAAQAGRYGFPDRHRTWDAVLEDPDVETVVLVVPPDAHEPLALQALEDGKHVVCE